MGTSLNDEHFATQTDVFCHSLQGYLAAQVDYAINHPIVCGWWFYDSWCFNGLGQAALSR